MPFPPKKPNQDKPQATSKAPSKPPFPPSKPLAVKEEEGVPEDSAPEIPGQAKPSAEAPAKASEGDDAPLPKEADEAKKAAPERPKGLASVATMNKEEVEKGKGGHSEMAMSQMLTIVESMARLVQKLSPPTIGPGAVPGGTQAPPAHAPRKQLSMDEIAGVMNLMDAINAGRISRQGAAILISQGFGIDLRMAAEMVLPDPVAGTPEGEGEEGEGEEGEGEEGEPSDVEGMNSEEEEMEGEEEEGEEGDPEEEANTFGSTWKLKNFDPEGPAPAEQPFGSTWKLKKFDSADSVQFDDLLKGLQSRKAIVEAKLEALQYTMSVVRNDYDDDQLRDESGKWSGSGAGGGGGGKRERDMKSVPHTTVDKFWRSAKPEADNKPEKARPLDKVFHAEARQAEREGNRAKADRLFKLAEELRGDRLAVKARMREEIKRAAEQFKKYPKEHPSTPKQGAHEYFKTNSHPANIEKLKTPQPKLVKHLGGGINGTHKITMEDGSKATWKPAHGERPGARSNVTEGTYYLREAAASSLARVLGAQDLVPAVVAFHGSNQGYRNTTGVINEHGPFGRPNPNESVEVTASRDAGAVGSLHAWAPGEEIAKYWAPPEMEREAVERARVFDYITGNSDRHGGNMLITERDGKFYPVLIDNGLSFNTKGVPDRVVYPSSTLRWNGLLDATKDTIAKIDPKEVAKALKASGLDRDASKLVLQRLHHLKDDPEYLDTKGSSSPHFVYTWRGEEGLSNDRKIDKALNVLKPYEALAEKTISEHDGTRK